MSDVVLLILALSAWSLINMMLKNHALQRRVDLHNKGFEVVNYDDE